jgi:hypothetical protein
MKTFSILASFSVIALAAALPNPQASNSRPIVTIQFFKDGEPLKKPIVVTVGAISDKEIVGVDAAEIVSVTDKKDPTENVAGAENIVCVFNKNGGSRVAGEASLEEPAVFDAKTKTITRTTCEFDEEDA